MGRIDDMSILDNWVGSSDCWRRIGGYCQKEDSWWFMFRVNPERRIKESNVLVQNERDGEDSYL